MMTPCEQFGHDDEVVYRDDRQMIWRCDRCGAEGWEDFEPTTETARG